MNWQNFLVIEYGMMNDPIAYIIDTYDPYNSKANENVVYTFHLYGGQFCIRATSLSWGRPILKNQSVEESDFINYHIYDTLEEAMQYVHELKKIEGVHV